MSLRAVRNVLSKKFFFFFLKVRPRNWIEEPSSVRPFSFGWCGIYIGDVAAARGGRWTKWIPFERSSSCRECLLGDGTRGRTVRRASIDLRAIDGATIKTAVGRRWLNNWSGRDVLTRRMVTQKPRRTKKISGGKCERGTATRPQCNVLGTRSEDRIATTDSTSHAIGPSEAYQIQVYIKSRVCFSSLWTHTDLCMYVYIIYHRNREKKYNKLISMWTSHIAT